MAQAKFYMPPVCFIVARTSDTHVIGCEGKLPWRLKTDLSRFRSLTINHAVIMGRKTYDSIGRPLPSRLNVVVSRRNSDSVATVDLHGTETKLLHSRSTEDALFCSDLFTILNGSKRVFVIGGAEVYKIFQSCVDRVYLTEVHAKIDGDATFDQIFSREDWKKIYNEYIEASASDQYPSTFSIYDRRISLHRLRNFASIYEKKETASAYMRSITNLDAKIIEDYAFRHFREEPKGQVRFRFDEYLT